MPTHGVRRRNLSERLQAFPLDRRDTERQTCELGRRNKGTGGRLQLTD